MNLIRALALATLVATACGPNRAIAPAGLFFLTAPRGNAYPAALITGTLVESDGCLFIDDPYGREGTALPLWPEGYRAERQSEGPLTIFDGDDRVATVGDAVRFGGGFRGESPGEVGTSEDLIGRRIPDRCRADGYWIVSP